MSKKNNTAEVIVEPTTTEAPKSEQSGKSLPYPTDGSKASEAIAHYGNVSKAIRELAKNHSRGEVAKMLGKRYQHVRNVLITPIKKTA